MESLDLHGLGLDEALQKVQNSLDWVLKRGVDILDINHGKGYHSRRNIPIIKTEVRRLLKTMPEIKASGYKVIYGEADFPVCLTFDAGHTLILQQGLEHNYIGGQKQQEKNKRIFSDQARRERKFKRSTQGRGRR